MTVKGASVFRLSHVLSYPAVRAGLSLAIVAVSLAVLHHLAKEVSWSEIRADLAATSPKVLALALASTLISYVGIALYDVIALRTVAPGRVPTLVAATTGASGYAISNMLGFSYLTGIVLRFRIYGARGLDVGPISLVFLIAWGGFWLGLAVFVGGLMAFLPTGLPQVLPFDRGGEIAIGWGLLGVSALIVVLLHWRHGERVLFGVPVRLPSPGQAIALAGAAIIDMSGATLALYLLIPADLVPSYPVLVMIFITATTLGVISHAPGGIGVFEATMIAGLGAAGRPDMLAALLLYRVIYFAVPFILAIAALSAIWLTKKRHGIGFAADWTGRLAKPLVPLAAAGLSLAAGLVLLISGNLPSENSRMELLRDLLPLPLIEASHLIASVTGVFLIVLARALYRRLYSAWLAALMLLGVGMVASLVKGLAWQESLVILATAILLIGFRAAFYRVKGAAILRLNLGWFLSVAALVGAVTWIGLFAFKHVEYRQDLWWQFAWEGDASRYLRASLAVAVVLAGTAWHSVLSGRGRSHLPEPIPDAVRGLLLDSPDSEANLALLGDKSFLINENESAFLAFADTGKALVTKGEPVGDETAGADLLWRFREMADREGKRCVFYAVGDRYLETYLEMGLSVLKIGEVARVDLTGFSLDTPQMRNFRQARNRAMREGYEFALVPASELEPLLPDLRAVSDAWLAHKQGEEKSFAMGAFLPDYLRNFDHAVLRAAGTGRIVAFANLMRGDGVELSVDLMRYDSDGLKVAMDALFAEIMLWGAAQDFRWFSLGAAPLAGVEARPLASVWHRLAGFAYAHGERIYHFEGLRAFKQKFNPVWTPNYLACSGSWGVPQALYEVNTLVSGGVSGLMRTERHR
ncbi:bifunctional lysylphosphatidylglycerol flippase/synthetase MprF [Rhodovulum marinum]|uniref:Phosphatidylglycerol lysyltransferase n=1 Tax=Rhodovulum marinum TaxID=320662 RepID=A0A4R2PVC2_9RHOB|nr:bifunctional lysylphosphatidylglycerol flippase/synthetase MprF [Rhodovulum marinum]TCP40023.1 phosphatidylglycerol lysyltransferase [Rhodovulum marinum]